MVDPEHDAKDEVHLQTLLAESQYDPEVRPTQELVVPHLQAPEPLLAVLSHDSGAVQEARDAVHLQTLLTESQ